MNFVCIVFKKGVKMLTLSSLENLIEECNLPFALSSLNELHRGMLGCSITRNTISDILIIF